MARVWVIAVALAALVVGLGSDAFFSAPTRAEYGRLRGVAFVNPIGREIPQWVVAAVLLVYWFSFAYLERRVFRLRTGSRTGSKIKRLGDGTHVGEAALTLFLIWATVAYVSQYDMSATSGYYLVLLWGVVLAQFFSYVGTYFRCAKLSPPHSMVLGLSLMVLFAACILHPSWVRSIDFRYHQVSRLSGLWENPNTYGALMAVGLVLSLGVLLVRIRQYRPMISGVCRLWPALPLALGFGFLAGLVGSFSRAAWLGAVAGTIYLVCCFWRTALRDGDSEKGCLDGSCAIFCSAIVGGIILLYCLANALLEGLLFARLSSEPV